MQTAVIEFRTISKRFGAIEALAQVSLAAIEGEFVALIGPSGSGKSTLFNIAAGLELPDQGQVLIHGRDLTGRRGELAYMPQRDALLPWRSVLENAILPAIVAGHDPQQARIEAERLLEPFGLAGFGNARPAALSGGMRQRAALLRTVLWHCPIMLLDEPFGALDAITRMQMQQWLLGLWDRLDRTILMVTHDVEEALLLADRVYILTPRPARIAAELRVELPRPRSYDLVASAEFAALKGRVLRELRAEMR